MSMLRSMMVEAKADPPQGVRKPTAGEAVSRDETPSLEGLLSFMGADFWQRACFGEARGRLKVIDN
jgi:hypothetical protein